MTPDDETGRTLPASGAEMAPEDADAATRAREARYAEAWNNAEARWCEGETHSADAELGRDEYCARAVMAVADAEQAELRAEVERTKRGARELGRILDRTLRDALDASGRHDAIDEDGDGDWAVVWETLSELRPRAEAAEAELRALREGIEALADEWWERATEATSERPSWRKGCRALRALLAPSPAATTGEADDEPDGCRLNGCHPAPVSSGEAGTGEAVQS